MLGLTSVTFRNLNYMEIVDLCQQEGVDCIEWGADIHVPVGDLEHAQEVADYTREHGIDIYSYGTYYRIGQETNSLESFSEIIKTADVLKCKLIRIWAGSLNFQKTTPEYYANIVSHIKEIAELAAEHGLMIGLEYHRGTLTEDAKTSYRLIQDIAQDNVRLYWQMNPEITHEERLKEITLLRPYLCNIHVFYWDVGLRYELCEKVAQWIDYIDAIQVESMHYIIEFVKDDSQESFKSDVATMKKLLTRK